MNANIIDMDDRPREVVIDSHPRWSAFKRLPVTVTQWALEKLGAAGSVKPMSYYDEVSETQLDITTSRYFTVLSINGRDFYFKRISGEFGGTGSGCDN